MLYKEIALYLSSVGLGSYRGNEPGGDIFICKMPSEPDELIAIYPSGGDHADCGNAYENPTVEIIVRGSENAENSLERAQSVYDALHGFAGKSFTPGGQHIVSCLGVQSAPNWLGRDSNNRTEFSLNFVLRVKNDNRRN